MNFVLQLFIYAVLAIAGSIMSAAEAQQQKKTPGVRTSRQEGGNNPLAVVVGKRGIPGQFEYWADWGEDGGAPNAFHSEVYSLGDKPYHGFTGFGFNGARGTLRYDQPHPELGIPVEEARDANGKDHCWVKFYDGRQTVADAMLVARTAGEDRPWTADMVFRGCPYAVVTTLVNREIFTGIPTYWFEVEGIDQYDMSLDSSVGGDGPQRYDDESTWAYSADPVVIASNIFLGIRYEGEWLYGGQTITPYQLPPENWIGQILKSKARGFTCGYEIVCGDVEPHAAIGECLMAAAGRVAEIGGIYKVLVAEPDEPVRAFTDEDIVITEDDELDPFPGLEATCNVISSTYPEPAEGWGMKEAPSRYSAALEAEDDGRRLPKSITYNAVYDAEQVQELDNMALEEARRFRSHINVMPAAWWEAEPFDVELWSSARNGYDAKSFMIIAMDDLANADQLVARREIEPDDYNWSPGMALPWTPSPLVISRPAPQVVSGPSVAPVPGELAYDAFWSSASVAVDVQFVRVSHRLPADDDLQYTALIPKPDLLVGSARVPVPLGLSGTEIEVQLEYIAFSGRPMVASAWMPVTIADVRIGADDMTEELQELFDDVDQFLDEELPVIVDELEDINSDIEALAGAPNFVYGNAYLTNDLVRYSGGIYKSTADNTNELPTNPAFWLKVGDYNSVAGTVVGFTARFDEVEDTVEQQGDNIVQTTRDVRRVHNALMLAAMLNSEQGANQVAENSAQLAATASVSQTVQTEVSRIDGVTTAQAALINVAQAAINTLQGAVLTKAEATALNALSAIVTAQGDSLTATAALATQLNAVIGTGGSTVVVKGEAAAAPSGFTSRYAIRLQTTNGSGIVGQATIFIDIKADGTSRIGFAADNTVFFLADGTPIALFDANGIQRSVNNKVLINWVTGLVRVST